MSPSTKSISTSPPISDLKNAVEVVLSHLMPAGPDAESQAWLEHDKHCVLEDFNLTADSELGLMVLNYAPAHQ